MPTLQQLAEAPQHLVLRLRLADLRPLRPDDERHRVEPEPGDAELRPESHDLQDLRLHQRVGGVEVGLEVVEAVVVPGLRLFVARPDRLLDAGKDDAVIDVRRPGVGPDVPVAVLGVAIAARGAEPGVLVGGVVDDQVDQHPHAALVGAVGEFDEIPKRAEARVDVVVVGDVVPVVALWRGLERHQPDAGDAHALQVVEAPQQSREISDAVAVGVHEAADGQAIDHCVLVPEVVDHVGSGLLASRDGAAARRRRGMEVTGAWFLMRRIIRTARQRAAERANGMPARHDGSGASQAEECSDERA